MRTRLHEMRVHRLPGGLGEPVSPRSAAAEAAARERLDSLVKPLGSLGRLEDLGAWLPLFTSNKDDYKWIKDVIEKCCEGVNAKIGWHFCFGNA